MSDVAVIGAGYVGLTTAVCLAHLGHDVVCADIDADRVDRLNKGEVPILEDGLPELLAEGLDVASAAVRARRAERGEHRRVRLPLRARPRRATTAPPTSRSSTRWHARSHRCCDRGRW